MKLSDADKLGMSPEEIAVLEDDTPVAAVESEPEPQQAAEPEPQAAPPEAAAEPEPEPEPEPRPAAKLPTYELAEGADFDTQRKALRAQVRDVEEEWSTGKLTDAERADRLETLQDQIDNVLKQQTRAETISELNAQAQRNSVAAYEKSITDATMNIISTAKAAGTIDYVKDVAAQKQFDMAMGMLNSDPSNASKTPSEIAQAAHRAVLSIRGIQQAPAVAQNTAPARREVPMTLGGLPNAAPVGLQDETLSQFSRLSGEDAERFLARLPAAEVDRLMRGADSLAAAGAR